MNPKAVFIGFLLSVLIGKAAFLLRPTDPSPYAQAELPEVRLYPVVPPTKQIHPVACWFDWNGQARVVSIVVWLANE